MSAKIIPFYKTARPAPKNDFESRMERIKTSMEKINSLIAELKDMEKRADNGNN